MSRCSEVKRAQYNAGILVKEETPETKSTDHEVKCCPKAENEEVKKKNKVRREKQ